MTAEFFYRNKTRPTGFRSQCKECRKEYDSRPEVKEYKKEYNKEYDSRPEVKEYRKEYRSRPEVKEYNKGYDSRPEAKIRSSFQKALWTSKKIKREFSITMEFWESLCLSPCTYCSVEALSYIKENNLNVNGVDRINSDKGYIMDNVTPCCAKCNRMKWAHSVQEFLNHAERIAEHNKAMK